MVTLEVTLPLKASPRMKVASFVGDNYVETDGLTRAWGTLAHVRNRRIAFRCLSSSFFVSPSGQRGAARRGYPGQITFAIANTGAGATGQIDPAAVTYRLVSEQHKNVITPVIANASARGAARRSAWGRRERGEVEWTEGGTWCLVWQCGCGEASRGEQTERGKTLPW